VRVYFTVRLAVVACVKVAEVPVNVTVDVPRLWPFGVFKSTVAVAVSDALVSVSDAGVTWHVDIGGPPLQVKTIVPEKPVVEDSARV
jgi:hypothetical protein